MDFAEIDLLAVQAFEKASGKKVNYKIVPRRGGDSSAVYAATETAKRELGWVSKLDVNDMCRDQWAWATVRSFDLSCWLLHSLHIHACCRALFLSSRLLPPSVCWSMGSIKMTGIQESQSEGKEDLYL